MVNYFNFNMSFPFGMNNWFMPVFSFRNIFSPFQMYNFNPYNNWFNNFSIYYNNNILSKNGSYAGTSIYSQQTKSASDNSKTDTFTKTTTTKTKTVAQASNIDYKNDDLKLDDYNAFKGERLADIALNRSVGWTGYCARYVKNAIQLAGLGSYQYGHAYQMTNILRHNNNFEEISTDNLNVKKLPAGCVLVYDKDTEGYSKKYGHTEITTGDGRAVSDGITKNLYKKPSAVFIPV